MGYRAVRWVAQLLLSLFYRRYGVLDLHKLPLDAPLVVAANHHGSLIDPLALLASLPRTLRPLAKAPLFGNPVIGPFLRALGALPVYRPQDRHLVSGSNREMLAACRQALAAGGAVLIFPEGISKAQPTLSGLRPGAARICLEAEAEAGYRLGSLLLPVAIHLDDSAWFRRGKVLVQIGDPIVVAELAAEHQTDPEAAVRELTARLEQALADLIIAVESTETLRLLRLAVRAWSRQRGERLNDAAETATARDFARAYRTALGSEPEAVLRLRAAVDSYARTLEHFAISGDEIDLVYRPGRAAGFVLLEGARLLVGAPLGLLGAVLHWPPFHLTGLIAGRMSESEDVWASTKIASAVVLFPLWWLALAATLGIAVAPLTGALALAVLPLLGLWAIRFRDRQNRFFRQIRAFFLLAGSGGLKRHLQDSRRAIHDDVERLRARLQTTAAGDDVAE